MKIKSNRGCKTNAFTTFYWSILTEEEDQYRIGYKSLFYKFQKKILNQFQKMLF